MATLNLERIGRPLATIEGGTLKSVTATLLENFTTQALGVLGMWLSESSQTMDS